jgi:hypothetical protein
MTLKDTQEKVGPLLTYEDFVKENSVEFNGENNLSEMAKEIHDIAKKTDSKDLKNKLKAKLKGAAPSLADDDDFMSQLAKSFKTAE